MTLLVEQLLNGVQYGFMLFLLAAGLTLIFGIMGIINLAHGSFYMAGAFIGTWTAAVAGSFWIGLLAALAGSAIIGIVIEFTVIRRLYARDHLEQVLIFNQLATIIFGRQPLMASPPALLSSSVELLPGLVYPVYRLAIIAVGLAVAAGLYLLINRTRIGMLIRAGASDREMVRCLGVRIGLIYTLVFGLGIVLAGLAGYLAGPIYSVQAGMGDRIILPTFVVVVVGGVGSIRGAFVAALLLGVIDTLLRAYAPGLLRSVMESAAADTLGGGLASMGIYLLMALVLLARPQGFFPAKG
jgi:branched-chain amino acid transport system permease protein